MERVLHLSQFLSLAQPLSFTSRTRFEFKKPEADLELQQPSKTSIFSHSFFVFRSPLLIILIDAIKYQKLIRYDMRTFFSSRNANGIFFVSSGISFIFLLFLFLSFSPTDLLSRVPFELKKTSCNKTLGN